MSSSKNIKTAGHPLDTTGTGTAAASAAAAGMARPKHAPLPAPPPGEAAGVADASSSTSGVAVGGNNVAAQEGVITPKSDGDTPNLMNADWNWDEDTLDSTLFSFLLDNPPPE